jgi:hypothetical protein
VLQLCAPLIRQNSAERDWGHYARRTVEYAFGAAGQRQADELQKYWPQWQQLEAQQEVPQQPRERERERERSPGMSR